MRYGSAFFLLAMIAIFAPYRAATADTVVGPGAPAEPSAVRPGIVSQDTIIRFSPRARADVVGEIAKRWGDAENAGGLVNQKRIQQFFAELAVETGGLVVLEENLNYSVAGLIRVWPGRFNAGNASAYAGNPIKLALNVYGGRLGNKKGTSDGWTYRGSGLIQLTGRGNFRARGHELQLGSWLEDNPDSVRQPLMAFKTAYAYWAACGANALADAGDTAGVRKAVNGGLTGLSTKQIWLARARRTFVQTQVASDAQAVQQDENLAVLSRLQELGYSRPAGVASGVGQSGLQESLKQFQGANGLPQTGTLDDDTLYRLTDPQSLPKQ